MTSFHALRSPALFGLALGATLLLAAPARADTPPAPAPPASPALAPTRRAWSLDVGAATAFPIMVAGAQVTLEAPYRILAQAEVGWLGKPYVAAIDGFLVAIKAYDEATSEIIRASLQNSLVVRLSAGMRPFERHGLEILGGYTLVTLGGDVSAKQTITTLTGQQFPDEASSPEIPVRTTLHSFHVGLGWRWVLKERWVVRASLSYLQTVASKSKVEVDVQRPAAQKAVDTINAELDDYMNTTYTTWVKTPVVGLSVAYRF